MAVKVTNPTKVPKNAVRLSKVSSLTLRAGKQTSSRRVAAVPQLDCVGPEDVCKLYEVDVMRCTNEGADYDADNIQWTCKASLPEEFKLGSTDVFCEGYESSDDPYVLKGSCAVEYRLLLTDTGEQKYRPKQDTRQSKFGWPKAAPIQEEVEPPRMETPKGSKHSGNNGSEKLAGYVFFAIFFAVAFIILRAFYRSWTTENRRPPPRTRNNGGGGGDDDPPPPYDFQPEPKKKSTPRPYTYTPQSTSTRSPNTRRDQTQDGWRPGPWSAAAGGAAAGAAAGYAAGRRSASTQTQQPQTHTQERETQQRGGPFSWFNPSTPNTHRNTRPPSPPGASSSSSTPSFSTSRHESTGFGGTKRR